jgi:hypothetical protein
MTDVARKFQPTQPGPTTMTHEEWVAEATRRFGDDATKWRFKCPSCAHVASVGDWKAAGAPETSIAFSCVGRWLDQPKGRAFVKGHGPCNYAGGGLFKLNPVTVIDKDGKEHSVFEFASS